MARSPAARVLPDGGGVAPEGWDKGASVLFWQRREVKAMFSVYRAPAEPAFTSAELGLLLYLQPFIGTAIDRVRLLHSERLARRGLEEFNKRLPVGLLTLNWNLRAVFANPEGLNACALWNLGPAARTLREAIAARNPKELRTRVGDLAQVAHPEHAGLVATISASHNPASALASDPRVLAGIARAEGIFLAGGDQSTYVRRWQDTPLAAALPDHVRAGRPLGGTSAAQPTRRWSAPSRSSPAA